MKTCVKCSETKPLEEFHLKSSCKDGRHPRCRVCRVGENRRRLYGLSEEDIRIWLIMQGNRCAACYAKFSGDRKRCFHVDHCHETGRVRGLLCNNCNVALGLLGDDPARVRDLLYYAQTQAEYEEPKARV